QDSVLIAASITDSEGTISTAILNWKRNAETTIYEEEMVYDGTQFTSYIPAQEAGKTIYFMIVATDNDNAETSYMDGMYTITSSSGFENTDLSEAIHIYPNPTRDVINILVNETVSNCKIAISNMLGVKILEEEAPVLNGTYLVNLSGKPKGFYYLTITTNEVIINKKIVLF
ncbi:MAG: T9SS type A sorting domain-containing protein, partial [Bacteroidales bacterium]